MTKRNPLSGVLAALAVCPISAILAPVTASAQAVVSATPLTYVDLRTGVMIYVETNRNIVSGVSKSGHVMWTTDPLKDSGIGPYRFADPKIVFVGSGNDRAAQMTDHPDLSHGYVAVTYNSSQFGLLDETTGKFKFEGQD